MTTRPGKGEDVAALAALDATCFGARRWPPEAWEEVVLHPACLTLVAEAPGGELAGAAVLLCQRPVSSLASLAVAPAWRGCGIGSALLTDCLRRCRGACADEVVLEVDEDNEPALRLYRRFGFRPRRSFEDEGIRRLEMTLTLAGGGQRLP